MTQTCLCQIKLEELYQSLKFELYDLQKDRLENIKPTQPEWVHPNWTRDFSIGMEEFIKKYPTSREAVERWMVGKIQGKMLYKSWHSSKTKEINKFIKKHQQRIVGSLKFIKQIKTWKGKGWPLGTSFFTKLEKFAQELRLNVKDVYEIDVMKFVEKHYKNVNVEVLEFDSDSDSESDDESESKKEIDHSPLQDQFEPTTDLQYSNDSQ